MPVSLPLVGANGPINAGAPINLAPNGGVDFWLANEATALTVATANSTYGPENWYVKNASGGDVTIRQVTGVVNGSAFGVKCLFANTPSTSNNMELYYILPNTMSQKLYGLPLSASLSVIAFGNITKIGVTWFAKTTEAKLDTAVGAEVSYDVNTSKAVQVGISLPLGMTTQLGTAPNVAGVLGLRIRALAASSGNIYDNNNGYQVEQLMLTSTTTPVYTYQRFGATAGDELDAVQLVYQKNFPIGTAPAQNAGVSAGYNVYHVTATGESGTFSLYIPLPIQMRATPTIVTYNPGAANANWRDITGAGDLVAALLDSGSQTGFTLTCAGSTAAHNNQINWTADARI